MKCFGPMALAGALLLAACDKGEAPVPPFDEPPAALTPGAAVLHRLTVSQYKNSLRDLFGADLVLPTALEPDKVEAGLLSVGASIATISPWGVEQYESAAYDLADQIIASPEKRAALLDCTTQDDACRERFVNRAGRKIWRRPLTEAETTELVTVARTSADALGSFEQGLTFALASMLQSPQFLFRVELGTPDTEGALRYDGWEMASRLSYFLWNTTPDDALLDAAERGELDSPEGIAAHARRMIDSPRARAGVRSFFAELFELYLLDELAKDPNVFSHYTTELGPIAREETLLGLEHLIFELDGDYREILTTRQTFVDRRLAAIYDVRATAREGFGAVTFPESSMRRGLLGQVSVLALHSHPVGSSATLRGAFVRQKLLCATIPPPPVNANTGLPEPSGTARTLRDRVKEHLTNPSCAACHNIMDPVGLGLENFDGIGRYRTEDNGARIDPADVLDGVAFANPVELAAALHDHPELGPCFTQNLYRYATGRVESAGEAAVVAQLSRKFAHDGYRVRSLLFDIATSPAFAKATEAAR